MPLWKIYHPADAYSAEDKRDIAQAITSVYGRVMPKFYVGVVFEAVSPDNFFIGGEPHPRFVRIAVDHIARTFQSDELKTAFMSRMSKLLATWTSERGLDWEIHVDETPFELWTIQGHFPPREGTEDEKRWMAENRASPRTNS